MDGFSVVGITSRTLSKATDLADKYGIENVYNDIDLLITKCELDGIMVLVSADQIFNVAKKIMPTKIPLFIEKPAGLIQSETKSLTILADEYSTANMVGYNRRYYSIFHSGIDIINKYGNLLGVSVEGHERFWKIENIELPKILLDNWIYANSTHTIDLLRLFGGGIKSFSSYSKSIKRLNNDQFVAAMEFDSGALGTYTSHWFSPGGWNVKLYGVGVTVIFKPLEKGIWLDNNFVEHSIIPDEVDIKFKPGFYRQIQAFGELIRNDKLNWPGINLENALITMELAKKLSNV